MRLLTISGSLRAAASNTALLEAAALLAPPGVEMLRYAGLGTLPHFDPDRETDALPDAVASLRRLVGSANGMIISSPEYAHGVPGSLKNALDWLVGSTELPGLPVALVNASSRSTFAYAQLTEILRTMSAHLVRDASITIPLDGADRTPEAIAADARVASPLRGAIAALVRAIDALPADHPCRHPR